MGISRDAITALCRSYR